ncbi:MAG: nucleoid-associated protein YejK [Aestuariibacter sp.]
MSAIIQNFIIHQLYIEGEKLKARTRNDIFEVNADLELFAQQLNHTFNNKPVRGIAGFSEPEEETSSFSDSLQQYLNGDDSFLSFSVSVCERLINTLIEQGSVETGFVVVSQYQFLATDYLLIAVLDTKEHVEITPQLNINVANHLDLAKMQLAARIDLTMLQTQADNQRYISFVKGRAGRKIADFFLTFLGCEEQLDVKQQNKMLLEQVEQYMDSEQLQPEEKTETRSKLVDYYKEKVDSGEEINISEVTQTLSFDDQKQDFSAFNQQTESPVEDSFQADRAAIKSLSKFSGQGGGLSLSFDRKLLGERVSYQADSDTLIIRGLPPNLKDQLSKWKD